MNSQNLEQETNGTIREVQKERLYKAKIIKSVNNTVRECKQIKVGGGGLKE